MSFLRRRKGTFPNRSGGGGGDDDGGDEKAKREKAEETESREGRNGDGDRDDRRSRRDRSGRWSCVDGCCWFIGCVCSTWWLLLFMYNAMPASFPQYVTEAITGPLPDPPGVKLRKEGLAAKHPVVFVPGIVTGGLELWEGRQCADGLFRKRLWGGTFGELYKRSSN